MPTIDISQLTALDDRAPDPPRRAPAAAPDPFAPPPAASFAPPREPGDAGDDQVIGVERSTRAIRIENQFRAAQPASRGSARSIAAPAASAPSPASPPVGSLRGVALAIALIAAVAVAAAVIALRPPSAAPRPAGGVSIRIIAREPTEVTIDGRAAGKTPLTLQRPPGTAPVLIGAPGTARQVIPDRDQTIDVTPR
jgi:hypothetical protein